MCDEDSLMRGEVVLHLLSQRPDLATNFLHELLDEQFCVPPWRLEAFVGGCSAPDRS
jgi:hypothetical protein